MNSKNLTTTAALVGLSILATTGLLLLLSEPQAESLTDWIEAFAVTRLAGFGLLTLAAAALHYGLKHGHLDTLKEIINEED